MELLARIPITLTRACVVAVCTVLASACGRLHFEDRGDGNHGSTANAQASAIAVASAAACAIVGANRDIWCWGRGDLVGREVGGTGIATATPAPISRPGPWRVLAAGEDSFCAIDFRGGLWCWGDDTLNGSEIEQRNQPTAAMPDTEWLDVGLNEHMTVAIRADGTLWLWSWLMMPVQIGNDRDWVRVRTAGGFRLSSICAQKQTGDVYCYATDDMNVPVRLGAARVGAFAAYSGQYGWIDEGGALHLRALVNLQGELGTESVVPGPWQAVALGMFVGCAIDEARALRCWGTNADGQALVPRWSGAISADSAVQVPARIGWDAVALDAFTSCAIDGGDVYCGGQAREGVLGDVATRWQLPAEVPGRWQTVSPSGCGVGTDAKLRCWGGMAAAAKGDGTATRVPVELAGQWSSVRVGDYHACGLRGTEGVCWGSNNNYALATDAQVAMHTLPGEWQDLVAGTNGGCGLQAGRVLCWGDASSHPDGTRSPRALPTGPTAVVPLFARLQVGYNHACALSVDGQLWCWGLQVVSETPTSVSMASAAIARVDASRAWRAAAPSALTTCAIDTMDKLWCWGAGAMGALGRSDAAFSSAPVQVDDARWLEVAVMPSVACGLRADHTLWCWSGRGPSNSHALAVAGIALAQVPTAISTRSDWAKLTSDGRGICAIANDGAAWCWGGVRADDTAWTDAAVRVALP